MSNEINFFDETGKTLTYELVQGGSVIATGNLTERGSTGHYYGSVATPRAAGTYNVFYKEGSAYIGDGVLHWDGTKEVTENIDTTISSRSDFDEGSNAVTVGSINTNAIDADAVATDAITEIQSGLATQSSLDSKASQASVNAIPTAPLLASDTRLNNLDAPVSGASTFDPASDEVLANIKKVNNTSVTSIDEFKADVSDKLGSADIATIVSNVWSAATRSLTDKVDFALSTANIDAIVVAVQAGIINEGDGQQVIDAFINVINANLDLPALELQAIADRVETQLTPWLNLIDVAISTRSTQASVDTKASQSSVDSLATSVSNIPTTPLLASDTRLDNLDAPISETSTFNSITDAVRVTTDTASNIAEAVESNLSNALDSVDFIGLIKSSIETIEWQSSNMPIAEIVNAVWLKTLTSIGTEGTIGKLLKDRIDATITSRLAASSYNNPDNTKIANIETVVEALNNFDPATDSVRVGSVDTNAIDADGLADSAITEIQSGLATQANLNTKASQASVDSLDTKVTAKASQADVTAIKAATDKVNGLIEDSDGNRFTSKALEQAPNSTASEASIHSALDSYGNKDDYKSDVSGLATQANLNTKASQASVNQIPTNPVLDDDTRLDNLDAPVSDASTFDPSSDEVLANIKKVNNTSVTSINEFKAGAIDVDTEDLAADIRTQLERDDGLLKKSKDMAEIAARKSQ